MRLVLPACVGLLVFGSCDVAFSQNRLKCIQPAEPPSNSPQCTLRTRTNPASEIIQLKLVNPLGAGVRATFRVQAPSGTLQPWGEAAQASHSDPSGRELGPFAADTSGFAFIWSGNIGKDGVAIQVAALTETDRGSITTRYIILRPPSATVSDTLVPLRGDRQSWFEGQQLRRPVVARIVGANSLDDCAGSVVIFRPSDAGTAAPDSVPGTWGSDPERPNALICTAEVDWRLGKGVGRQTLRATIPDGFAQGTVFHANARALPRIITGVMAVHASEFSTIKVTSDTLTETITKGDTSVVRKRVVSDTAVDNHKSEFLFAPVVGIDAPIPIRLTRVRISGSVDVTNRDHFFAGFSIPQIFNPLNQESQGVDLHFVVQFDRRKVLDSVDRCTDAAIHDCDTHRSLHVGGIGVGVVVDGSGLLSKLLGAFGG